MTYLHAAVDCSDHHDLVRDFGGQRPKITVLCGSTRFVEVFAAQNLARTLAGEIVLSIGCDMRSDNELWADPHEAARIKAGLDELHKRKIDLADQVVVISDATGYFGDSTRAEIAYAKALGKPVEYLRQTDRIEILPGDTIESMRARAAAAGLMGSGTPAAPEPSVEYPPLVRAVFHRINDPWGARPGEPRLIGLQAIARVMTACAGRDDLAAVDPAMLPLDDPQWMAETASTAGFRAGNLRLAIVRFVVEAWRAEALGEPREPSAGEPAHA